MSKRINSYQAVAAFVRGFFEAYARGIIDAVKEAGGAFACTIEHGDITVTPTAKGFAMRCQRP